jgi:hypothetical protein
MKTKTVFQAVFIVISSLLITLNIFEFKQSHSEYLDSDDWQYIFNGETLEAGRVIRHTGESKMAQL